MEMSARFYARKDGAPAVSELLKQGEALVALGCDDPVVRYNYGTALHVNGDAAKAKPEIANAVRGFQEAQYPAARTYAAARRLARIWRHLRRGTRDDYNRLYEFLLRQLADAVTDDSFVGEERRLGVQLIMEDWNSILSSRKKQVLKSLKTREGADQWIVKVVEGQWFIDAAWRERGSDPASNVHEDAWKGFRTNLAQARTLLTEAWQMEPNYPEAPARMIIVSAATGDLKGARLWFDRAVAGQMDYGLAYSNILWALRPRWGGSHAEMYALGLACLETRRFDTSVPWHFFKAVHGIARECSDLRDAYRVPGVYEDLSRLLDGLIAEPTNAPNRLWYKSMHGVTAWAGGKYDQARGILRELGDQVDASVFGHLQADAAWVRGEVYAFTGPVGQEVRQAAELQINGQPSQALALFEQALAGNTGDERAAWYLRDCIARLRAELAVQDDQWVSVMPDSHLAGWQSLGGQWAVTEDGALEGRTDSKGLWLVSKAHLAGNFEIRADIELDPRSKFHGEGSVLWGYGTSGDVVCAMIRLYRRSGKIALARSGASVQDLRRAAVGTRNTVLVQVWESRVTVYLNAMPVFVNHHVPDDWWVRQGGRIGLASTDRTGAVVRYRNFEIRGLKRNPASER